ncbi:MAG: FAD-binding protein, partial [Flavobacteriaceae bacterium]
MGKYYYNEPQESYDAIVVGTGISGGWAAKELCENGLKTLVLERGRMVTHIKDYTTANMDAWDYPNAGEPTREDLAKQQKQNRTGYTTKAASAMWFVNDL